MNPQLQLTKMLLEFENLTFSLKKKQKQKTKKRLAPLWEAVCQRTSVITSLLPPAELHRCISQLLCGFCEAVCEVSTSL